MSAIVEILKYPAYAGTFAYGRTKTSRNGSGRARQRRLPINQWRIVVHDKHPAYINWTTYESNQAMLQDNHANYVRTHSRGVPREECGQLVIENIGGERVSLTNYLQVSNAWVADPAIVFYAGPLKADPATKETVSLWFPIEVNQLFGGWQLCGELDQRGDLVIYDEAAQFEMAQLAEGTMATVLIAQNWLEEGRRSTDAIHAWTPEEIHSRDIRVEEMGDVPF